MQTRLRGCRGGLWFCLWTSTRTSPQRERPAGGLGPARGALLSSPSGHSSGRRRHRGRSRAPWIEVRSLREEGVLCLSLSFFLLLSPKDAFRAVKKRIVGNKNFHEVMLALTVSAPPVCPSVLPSIDYTTGPQSAKGHFPSGPADGPPLGSSGGQNDGDVGADRGHLTFEPLAPRTYRRLGNSGPGRGCGRKLGVTWLFATPKNEPRAVPGAENRFAHRPEPVQAPEWAGTSGCPGFRGIRLGIGRSTVCPSLPPQQQCPQEGLAEWTSKGNPTRGGREPSTGPRDQCPQVWQLGFWFPLGEPPPL